MRVRSVRVEVRTVLIPEAGLLPVVMPDMASICDAAIMNGVLF